MNKFTRSQMGKIMAYALSAAMAVTVVPTYMKPVTTYAAEVAETQEVSNGQTIKVTVTAEKATRFALFEKSTEKQTGDKAVYVFDAVTTESSITSASIPVPYDVPAGTYFVGALENDVDDKTATSSSAEYTVKADAMVKINAATAATSIQASAEGGSTIYLKADTDATKIAANETIKLNTTVVSPSADATYNSVSYKLVDEKGNDKTDASIDIDEKGNVKFSQGSETSAFGTYYFKATATLAPRSSSTSAGKPLTSIVKVEIKEATELDSSKSELKLNRSVMVLEDDNDYATLDAKILTADEKDAVTESLKWEIEENNGSGESSEENGIVTYRDTDGVYATYEIATGKFTPKKAGTYKIKCTGKVSNAEKESEELKVYDVSLPSTAIAVKVGATAETKANLTCDVADATYSYAVKNTDIATVEQKNASDDEPKIVAVSAGSTKLIATIKYYDKGKEYSVTRTQDIVSTVDAKDLDLSKIENPEGYVDSVIATADADTKDVIIAAILDGTIDATKLAPATIASLDTETEVLYGSYFSASTDTGYSKVTANGLILSAVYDGILDEDAPKNPVEVSVVAGSVRNSDKANCVEGSVADFVAEYTIDGKLSQPNTPIALTYTATAAKTFDTDKKYDIYENGVKIATVKPNSDTEISFTTSGFSVFSIVEADADTPDEPEDIYDLVNFSAHVQRRIGTDDEADIAATVTDDGLISLGTHGQSRRVEMITLNGLDPDSVEMTAHVQRRVDHPEDVADLTQVVNEDGSISLGTEHQSRRLEAFSMNLKGDLADQYDVYYRVHAQNVGWLGWAKNGELAGTSHKSLRLEEIEIVFVEKGTEFDASQYVAGHEDGDRGYLNSETAFIDGSVK